MKTVTRRSLCLLAALVLTVLALPAHAQTGGTCEALCRTSTGLIRETLPDTGQSACCSGEVLTCPAGSTLFEYFWGNPLGFCPDF